MEKKGDLLKYFYIHSLTPAKHIFQREKKRNYAMRIIKSKMKRE